MIYKYLIVKITFHVIFSPNSGAGLGALPPSPLTFAHPNRGSNKGPWRALYLCLYFSPTVDSCYRQNNWAESPIILAIVSTILGPPEGAQELCLEDWFLQGLQGPEEISPMNGRSGNALKGIALTPFAPFLGPLKGPRNGAVRGLPLTPRNDKAPEGLYRSSSFGLNPSSIIEPLQGAR